MISVAIPVRQGGSANVTLQSLAKLEGLQPDEIIIQFDQGRGANWARNRAAEKCSGDYILWSDDDILWEPYAVETLFYALEATPHASYSYGAWQIHGGARHGLQQSHQEFCGLRLLRGSYISTMSLMRRDHFPGFDENLHRLQDWELYLRMWRDYGRSGVQCGSLTFTSRDSGGISAEGNDSWQRARDYISQKHALDLVRRGKLTK